MIQKLTYFCVSIIKRQLTQTHKSQISTAIKKVMARRPHNAKLKELRLVLPPPFSPPLYCLLNSICSVKMLNSLHWLSLLVSLFILFIHSINHALTGSLGSHIYFIYVFFMSLSEALQFSKMPHSLLNCFQYSTILCTINYFVIIFFVCVFVCGFSLFPFRISVWTAFIAMANIISTHNCVVILCFIFNLIMASYKE